MRKVLESPFLEKHAWNEAVAVARRAALLPLLPTESRRSAERVPVGGGRIVHAWTEAASAEWVALLNAAGSHYLRLFSRPEAVPFEKTERTTYVSALRTALSLSGDVGSLEIDLSRLFEISGIVTGRRLYEQFDNAIRGRRQMRKQFEAFEQWFGDTFYQGKPVTFIPRHPAEGNPSIVVEIDGEERELENVGDGLQQLLILTFPLFMANEGDAFFLEEPETHMHPGLQRAFLEVLLSERIREKNLVVFLTTHSNHIVSAALERRQDVSLFRFRRVPSETSSASPGAASVPKFEVTHVGEKEISLLDDLGVLNGSVFLAQCQIWVEGPSDATYFRAYMRSLERQWAEDNQKRAESGRAPRTFERLLENRDFVFVFYGGSLLDTVDFDATDTSSPFAAGNRILVVADKDKGKDAKHKRLEALAQKRAGAMVYRPLSVLEVENTIAAKHLERALKKLYVGPRSSTAAAFDVPEQAQIGAHLLEMGVQGIESYVKRGSWKQKPRLATAVCEVDLPWFELRESTRTLALDLDAFVRRVCGYTTQNAPSSESPSPDA